LPVHPEVHDQTHQEEVCHEEDYGAKHFEQSDVVRVFRFASFIPCDDTEDDSTAQEEVNCTRDEVSVSE
jgi:hypothetical protein